MGRVFLLASLLLFSSCISCKKKVNVSMSVPVNACLPAAIICKESLTNAGIWARVVAYYYTGARQGHAICVYEYQGKLWTYDSVGSIPISFTNKDDALGIAMAAEIVRGNTKKVVDATFLSD